MQSSLRNRQMNQTLKGVHEDLKIVLSAQKAHVSIRDRQQKDTVAQFGRAFSAAWILGASSFDSVGRCVRDSVSVLAAGGRRAFATSNAASSQIPSFALYFRNRDIVTTSSAIRLIPKFARILPESPSKLLSPASLERPSRRHLSSFVPFQPRNSGEPGFVEHPVDVIETSSLSSVHPPPTTYAHSLQRQLIEGTLSSLQVDTITLACEQVCVCIQKSS